MPAIAPIDILCVDDNQQVADAIRIKLARNGTFEWKGWLADATDLLSVAAREQPAIIILDIDMPGPDPFHVASALAMQCPASRVVFFTGHVRKDLIERGIESGAWGYAAKSDGEDALMDVISRVSNGEFAMSPEVRAMYYDL